jgi:hypothetical protein
VSDDAQLKGRLAELAGILAADGRHGDARVPFSEAATQAEQAWAHRHPH